MKDNFNLWIFCDVIDNYGDIGLTYRLAKILHTEKSFNVTLLVNELNSFNKICTQVSVEKNKQLINDITVINYSKYNYLPKNHPEYIIEMFGASIPKYYLESFVNKAKIWFNIEYITAEKWAKEYHLIPSIRQNGVFKVFYFLGFNHQSGNLIREHNYLPKKNYFLNQSSIKNKFINDNKLIYSIYHIKFFVFAYSYVNLLPIIKAIEKINKKFIIWICEGNLFSEVQKYFKINSNIIKYKNITIQKVNFIDQEFFDYYLWISDINIIRGEDSFIRAQLTNNPFIWNIYHQQDNAHIKKLNAFLNIYTKFFDKFITNVIEKLTNDLNSVYLLPSHERTYYWKAMIDNIKIFRQQSKLWNSYLLSQKTAIDQIVNYIEKN